MGPAALKSRKIRVVFLNPMLCDLEQSLQHCLHFFVSEQTGWSPPCEGPRLGKFFRTLRFWIAFCDQVLSCYMVQCSTARTGGTIILSTTSTFQSQRSCFMSSKVNSVFQVLGNQGLALNFVSPAEESLGERVVSANSSVQPQEQQCAVTRLQLWCWLLSTHPSLSALLHCTVWPCPEAFIKSSLLHGWRHESAWFL